MEFVTVYTSDGLRLVGLYSRAPRAERVIIHIHGYGGDFYSNDFVRWCHTAYPAAGVSFFSCALRTTGYLTEVYTEEAVRYVGSAVANQDDVKLDIDGIIDAVGVPADLVILQGHSFGTNIVKHYARSHPRVNGIILLSPADSYELYNQWENSAEVQLGADSLPVDGSIRWDRFGMAAGKARYPIPIATPCMERLLAGEVFHEWSRDVSPALQSALIVVGEGDPISALGTTGDATYLNRVLPNSAVVRIPGARHLFTGYERELCDVVTSWMFGQLQKGME